MNITSRYEALGMELPDPKTMCRGDCEGTGWYPTQGRGRKELQHAYVAEVSEVDLKLWDEAHAEAHKLTTKLKTMWDWIRTGQFSWRSRISYLFEGCDGWHFVKCPDCNGTGKHTQIKP